MKRTLVFHPFSFAFYLVLGVYSQNASQVPLDWLIRPLLILLASTLLFYLFLVRATNNLEYSGFVCTVSLIWLFSGHLYRYLLDWSSFWRTLFGGVCAIVLFTIPLVLLVRRRVWEKLSRPQIITTFLNAASVFLLVVPVWLTVSTLYRSHAQVRQIREREAQVDLPLSASIQSTPDIYLIILDGYGRVDFLKDVYGYDNSQFIDFLEKKGFYVAEKATSNYPQTELSISSSLNLDYLDGFVAGFGDTSDRSPLRELLQHTAVRRLLEGQGYRFVALPSASLFAQIRDADLYFDLSQGDINEFEGLLLSSTLAGVAVESFGIDLPVQSYELHRRYILYSLDKLMDVPDLPGPKFVFAHIMSPHPPFIFDRDGNFITPTRPYSTWDASLFPGSESEYQNGYIGQMIFLNGRIMDVVSAILEQSANPPIIIIQGDHGPGAYYNTLELDDKCLNERYSILNAYYFPDGDYHLLYPSISPVNTFRLILRQYFGANLDLLEDRSYFAGWLSPYVFTDVTEQARSACDVSARNTFQP